MDNNKYLSTWWLWRWLKRRCRSTQPAQHRATKESQVMISDQSTEQLKSHGLVFIQHLPWIPSCIAVIRIAAYKRIFIFCYFSWMRATATYQDSRYPCSIILLVDLVFPENNIILWYTSWKMVLKSCCELTCRTRAQGSWWCLLPRQSLEGSRSPWNQIIWREKNYDRPPLRR